MTEKSVQKSYRHMLTIANALHRRAASELSTAERRIVASLSLQATRGEVEEIRKEIKSTGDPLGDWYEKLVGNKSRRQGLVLTPPSLVKSVVNLIPKSCQVERIVDIGAGSGRFAIAAAGKFPGARIVVVERDPRLALIARANLAVCGHASRAVFFVDDFHHVSLEDDSRTLFVGNPPYVRHPLLGLRAKQWFARCSAQLGTNEFRSANLFAHAILKIALSGREGDVGALLLPSEWLASRFGKIVRQLMLDRLGLDLLVSFDSRTQLFPHAMTTSSLVRFTIGKNPATINVKNCATRGDIRQRGVRVDRQSFEFSSNWIPIVRSASRVGKRRGYIELGEFCRVRRGQATGNNRIWISGCEGREAADLPQSVYYPTVTRASELFDAENQKLTSVRHLRKVIDLPADLDALDHSERLQVQRFLKRIKAIGGDQGHIVMNRRPWWSVRLYPPAPLLMTYMSRRPATVVVNKVQARNLNIAHGIYPQLKLSSHALAKLRKSLCNALASHSGLEYSGGLLKFEPREVEKLHVPGPEVLEAA